MAIKFKPVRGKESSIKEITYTDGQCYFATDTGKIFLDANQERILMGRGGSTVYYFDGEIKEEVDGSYTFDASKITEGAAKLNDVIVTSEGALFRISELNGNQATCSIISSGGGGGGSTPGGSTTNKLSIQLANIRSYDILILDQEAKVEVTVSSDYEDVIKVPVNVSIINSYGGETTTIVKQFTATKGVPYLYDIGSLLPLGTNKVTFTAVSEHNGSEVRASNALLNLSTVVMSLKKSSNFNPLRVWNVSTGAVDFRCTPIGQDLNKTLYIEIDGVRRSDLTKTNILTSGADVQVSVTGLSHGMHVLKAILTTNDDMVSDSITYQVACQKDGNTAPIIWAKENEISIVNHEPLNVEYMVYDPTSPARTSVTYYVNGATLSTGTIDAAYNLSSWINWRITKYELANNELIIMCNGSSLVLNAFVEEDDRDLDVVKSGLILNLDAEGRSNKENISSRSIWHTEDKEDYVTFNNFNWYNNGWITDDDGNTCLRVSNGASISVPLNVLKDSILKNSYTFEFVFKVRNVQKYSSLITPVLDDATGKVTQTVSADEGVCLKYYQGDVGFCLGTQESFFSSKNVTISGRYVEDEVVHLTYVVEDSSISAIPLMYIYLNGLLSGVNTYDQSGDSFNTGRDLKYLTINSDYCDFDIYKIRVYESNLTAKDVVHNYIADKVDIDLYDANQIIEYNNNIPNINYRLMCQYNIDHPDQQMMPYAVIETTDIDNILPFKKMEDKDLEYLDSATGEWKTKKAWSVNIEFVNPALDHAYEKKLITDDQYLKGCPSFKSVGADLNVQGTSSQGYPIRNYKAKFKKADSWIYTNGPLKDKKIGSSNTLNNITYKNWYMDSEIATNKFTWKADFMESSGTHNGGLASFLGTVYDKHPLEDYGVPQVETDKLRTTVYGFPMMVFHKKSGGTGNGEIKFIGRYCFLLDKGCDENFGFDDVGDNLSWVKDSDNNRLGFADAAECWQVEDNQGGRCSFSCNYADADGNQDYEKMLTDTYVTTDGRTTLGIGKDFSVRYHPDKDEIEQAIDQRHDYQNHPTEANEFLKQKYARLYKVLQWVASTDKLKATNKPLAQPMYGYSVDSPEYRLEKFTKEFQDHFDLHYSIIYFIITELLMCFDSRGKNLMLATWGPHRENGNDIWYPIFYDMDTQLGINNSGVPYWDYYEEVTTNRTFSTPDSVLWNNLWECYKTQILTTYSSLRTSIITETNLNGYYDFDPLISKSYAMEGIRPLIMKNIDEYYKYINCAIGDGYKDTANKTVTTDGYFYCLQGDRKMRRNMLLRNRFNYYDSMWMGGSYEYTQVNGHTQRAGANNWNSTSDRYLFIPEERWTDSLTEQGFIRVDEEKANDLDAEWDFEITPYLKQYVSVYFDKLATPNQYCEDGDTVTIEAPAGLRTTLNETPNKQDQIFYLGGMQYISSLGDLSTKYVDRLDISAAKRLKDLILGNDNPNYYNNRLINGENFAVDDKAKLSSGAVNPNAKTLLEKVVLTNLGGLKDTLDFSGSEKIREMYALGTNLTSIGLADGVQVEKLYLPKTITNLSLKEPTSLTGYLTSKPQKVGDEYPNGLYLEGLTDLQEIQDDSVISLIRIDIIGGNMGYNSYKIVDKALKVKESMIENYVLIDKNKYSRELDINLERVTWSPYRLVEYGETINEDATYVIKTPHFNFVPYTPTDATWEVDTLNSKVYEYTSAEEANVITDLSLLDSLIEHYENGDGHIHGNNGNDSLTYISGEMFVNNSAENPIHESSIRDYYIGTYFPDLSIYVQNPAGDYVAEFVEILNNVETSVDTKAYAQTLGEVQVTPTEIAPSTRPHYDFLGWSTEKDGEPITDWSEYVFDEDHKEYTFYAIYKIHDYEITFVNGDGTEYLCKIPYGSPIQDPRLVLANNQTSLMVTYKDDSALDKNNTYVFAAWTKTEDVVEDVIALDGTIKSTQDEKYYSIFEVKDVHNQATSESYFEYYRYNDNGWRIAPKVNLRGKVTIPSTHEGKPVLSIGGFQSRVSNGEATGYAANVSGIYFLESSQVVSFEESAFKNCVNLMYIEYPRTLETIGQEAFNGCYSLLSSDLTNAKNLTTVQFQAFAYCWQLYENEIEIKLPASIKTLGRGAFYYNCGDSSDISRWLYYQNKLGISLSLGNHATKWIKSITIGNIGEPSELTNVGNVLETFAGVESIIVYYDNTSLTAEDDMLALIPTASTYPAYA